jgi:taurine--2-oxoglutarate transaminase
LATSEASGCFFALDLVAKTLSRKLPLDAASMGRIKGEIVARKLLPFVVDNRIHVVPPLIVTPEQIETALGIYDEALSAAGF